MSKINLTPEADRLAAALAEATCNSKAGAVSWIVKQYAPQLLKLVEEGAHLPPTPQPSYKAPEQPAKTQMAVIPDAPKTESAQSPLKRLKALKA